MQTDYVCCVFSNFVSMFAEFEKYIRGQVALTDEHIKLFREAAIEKTMRRKDFLLREGEVCRYKTFVSKGFLRMFRATENGIEHVMQFSPENSWITDPESYNNFTPSSYNIDAIEYSEVVMWTREDFKSLFGNIAELKAYSDKLVLMNLYHTRQRIFSAISATAEEKYNAFIKAYPNVITRAPLHMVASFLGVSRETLSRIRQAQVKQ